MGADRTRTGALAAGLALALLASGCAAGSNDPEGGWHGTSLGNPLDLPATTLLDTAGGEFTFAGSRDKPLTLVFFGYTNCPEICSQEMADLTTALLRLPEDDRDDVEVVFVTTDPARDDAATVTRYLSAFDSDYTGLTGRVEDIQEVASSFGVAAGVEDEQGNLEVAGEKGELGKDYMVVHTDHSFAVTDEGVVLVWNRDTTSKGLAEDIARLLQEENA